VRDLYHPHLDVSDQCFLKTLLTLKSWNRSFKSS
jgi:hypothetical protein